MVLRDDGQVIFSACQQLFHCADPLEAGAWACHEGPSLALQWSDKPILVNLDCVSLVDSIMEKSQDRSLISFLVSDIKEFFLKATLRS
jgi:hypothetical protein